MQVREKVGKPQLNVFFQWFVALEGRKITSLKRWVRSYLAKWEIKICTPLSREAHFQVKMYKTHHVRTTFGSWDIEKVHAVVARSTLPSQTCKKLKGTDNFWELRCRKSARRCGAEDISKSKCTKGHTYGPLLTVEMWFAWQAAGAGDCAHCQKWAEREGFVPVSTTIHDTTVDYTTQHSTTPHYTTLH